VRSNFLPAPSRTIICLRAISRATRSSRSVLLLEVGAQSAAWRRREIDGDAALEAQEQRLEVERLVEVVGQQLELQDVAFESSRTSARRTSSGSTGTCPCAGRSPTPRACS
jgi:hypothetical protein